MNSTVSVPVMTVSKHLPNSVQWAGTAVTPNVVWPIRDAERGFPEVLSDISL